MKNILTIDVEDWYQGLDLPVGCWPQFEKRLSIGLDFILQELDVRHTSATFFVLGVAALEHPGLVRKIASAGHEVAAHGWSHIPVYRQSRCEFRAELEQTLLVLQELTGCRVRGHRAAMFSLTSRSLWVLDEAAGAGLDYDSSLFPVYNYRYGIPGAPRLPYQVPLEAGQEAKLWELPISTLRGAGLNWPVGGGFYARFWPYALLASAIRRLNSLGQPAVFYFHPWEFDPGQPDRAAGARWLARTTHYHRLSSAACTLQRLLTDFSWTSVTQFLDDARARV